MPIDRVRGSELLKSFDFRRLFIEEIGWDKHSGRIKHAIDGHEYDFQVVTEKRGVVFLICDSIPDSSIRLKLDKAIAKTHFQHLIAFADRAAGKQVWQWVRYESGKPLSVRAQAFHTSQSGELLLQKLDHIVVSLEEEDQLAHGHIAGRLQAGFDVERITRRFYDHFKTEHDRFLKFIDGIPDDLAPWYASVMINRLMFIYFLQAKGFLNSDGDYLRNKLAESRDRKQDAYYREFLCPLFFQGFARKQAERPSSINKLLGNIPYLNGGLFQQHQIEELHGKKIDIPDAAFKRLLDFFKDYDWHLDDRPNRADNQINPDVLGYIFEKYINNKEMGAYYTKEDITEYISQNTIIPFLLDAARKDCAVAFDENGSVWKLLRDNPNRYIHNSVLHGTELPLPPEIAAGIADVNGRSGWNRPAPPEFALPTEIWREVVKRRRRCQELQEKLSSGQVHHVNDLVTLNLNIRQFAQDVIQYCEGPELLRALYKAISAVSVLDPTCGSGAFLFAALNILKPLYEACLQRMQTFLDELHASPANGPQKFKDFRQLIDESRQHPKQDYFILKRIIIDNLYGVDIMEEAVEICKLRLFLKLVAHLETGDRVEPLPDIDFNIRAGNTLVGYARYEDVQRAVNSTFDFENAVQRIEDKAKTLDIAVAQFREQQTQLNGTITFEDKQDLRRRFNQLEDELNDFLGGQYGVKKNVLNGWKRERKPFHWFCDFHGVLARGGFDVIIGNPPYVEESASAAGSPLRNLVTAPCGDLYAYVFERALRIGSENSRFGLIVPISSFGTDGFKALQDLIIASFAHCWLSSFANRPSQLFTGAQKRLTIVLGKKALSKAHFRTAGYLRWFKEEREPLITARVSYTDREQIRQVFPASVEKLSSSLESNLFAKMISNRGILEQSTSNSGGCQVYYTRKFGYFLAFLDFVPEITEIRTGRRVPPSELKSIGFRNRESADAAIAALSSSSFFWFWNMLSDCRNLNKRDLLAFPLDVEAMSTKARQELAKLGQRYLKRMRDTSSFMIKSGLRIQTFKYAECKPIIDEIDGVLAKHYGFTDEEMDFVVNYDIKYRLGADGGDEE